MTQIQALTDADLMIAAGSLLWLFHGRLTCAVSFDLPMAPIGRLSLLERRTDCFAPLIPQLVEPSRFVVCTLVVVPWV